jgi:NADPH:quinone reductase-like Zn-dependent oxidoreductase
MKASTVSYSDCRIRNGKWWGHTPLSLPLIPGIDFVGKIDGIDKRTSSRSGLRNGDTVMSLVRHGGNARYTQIGADQLVKVPDDLEAVDVVCLAEAYLSAFQAVHSGQRLLTRYKQNSLLGKSVLVLGALTNTGRAVVELANAAGATLIYAPCKAKHRERVRAMGTCPLGLSKVEWMPLLNKKLDLVIDTTIELSGKEENYFSALSEKGQYLFIGRTQNDVDKIITKWAGSAKLVCSSNRTRMAAQIHSCDVFEKWESNIESCKVS